MKVAVKELKYSGWFGYIFFHGYPLNWLVSLLEVDKQYINELFFGDITKHTAYIIKDGNI